VREGEKDRRRPYPACSEKHKCVSELSKKKHGETPLKFLGKIHSFFEGRETAMATAAASFAALEEQARLAGRAGEPRTTRSGLRISHQSATAPRDGNDMTQEEDLPDGANSANSDTEMLDGVPPSTDPIATDARAGASTGKYMNDIRGFRC
jgi:hypothetical protein